MATDPAPFLSTIILASAGLVAIVGGLLVARFVSLDSEQRGSRKVLGEATERLESARRRARDAHADVLDWHAGQFFRGPILDAASEGVSDLASLIQLGEWPFEEEDLRPFAAEVAEEFSRARAFLADRGSSIDDFPEVDGWDQFRRATPGLPDIRWTRVWKHVFENTLLTRAEERKEARRRQPRSRSGLFGSLNEVTEMTSDPAYLRRMAAMVHQGTDYAAIRARREDDLHAAEGRAQQRVEDYEAELSRLRQAHLEIVRPDARLWWGVIILTAYAVVGVALPMWEMSRGPDDLDQVSWIFYLFAAGLAALIIYIIVYMVQLTRAQESAGSEERRLRWPDRAIRALYTGEWHLLRRNTAKQVWP